MNEKHIELLLARPILMRLDDLAKNEIREALKKLPEMEVNSDVSNPGAMAHGLMEEQEKIYAEIISPIVVRYLGRKKDNSEQKFNELISSSPSDQCINYIANQVRLFSISFGIGFVLIGVCAILIAIWIKLDGNNWSREYLGAGISFIVSGLLQYFPWRLAGKFCSKTKKMLGLLAWLLINLTGVALHIVTRG
jgi:hypothetical protein